jgi:hypothetical protein
MVGIEVCLDLLVGDLSATNATGALYAGFVPTDLADFRFRPKPAAIKEFWWLGTRIRT